MIFFTSHFFGFVLLFYKEANASLGIFRMCIPIILAFYCALYSGLWFFCIQKTIIFFSHINFSQKKLGKHSPLFSISLISMTLVFWTYLYINWIRYGVFWIFGEFVGYPFAYPLLPLMQNSASADLLIYTNKSILLFLLILFSLNVALFFVYHKKKYIAFAFMCALPFLLSFLRNIIPKRPVFNNPTHQITSPITKHTGYISPISIQSFDHPLDSAQEIYYQMVKLANKNPQVTIIFMPESSYPFCLNQNQDVIDLWCVNILDDKIDLFIGAPYKENKKLYNALYWISRGKIKKIYKKTRLMAFAEYAPRFWKKFSYFRSLFSHNGCLFSHGQDQNLVFELYNGVNGSKSIKLKPLICSDFFMGRRKELKKIPRWDCSCVIIAVNDAIFPMGYLRNLMFLYAKLEAMAKKRDLLYVGYYFASWISKNGTSVHI
ncbi:hypothetical protein ACFLYU_01435 [Candidatus Dependentiae bacterium]